MHGTLVVGVSQTTELNRGRHLYSAGRPSRWALAHILVSYVCCCCRWRDRRCRAAVRRTCWLVTMMSGRLTTVAVTTWTSSMGEFNTATIGTLDGCYVWYSDCTKWNKYL